MTTVIYHSSDFDGIFCREIAKHFLGEKDVQYIGWNFGDKKITIPHDGMIYVLDLSPECLDWPTGINDHPNLIWIDHHKTSIDKWPSSITGYRIDGVAACRLAWQWFLSKHDPKYQSMGELPPKEVFQCRIISEPLAVRLAGEYDVWDKRDLDADTFQYSLRSTPLTDGIWDELLEPDQLPNLVDSMLANGRVAQYYAQSIDESICRNLTWIMEWEGIKWLCVNHARFNSLLFTAKDVPETGHDALLGFRFDGKNWMVSLYHSKHRTDLDLSEIAKRHGGGGHRGAAGYTTKTIPDFLCGR